MKNKTKILIKCITFFLIFVSSFACSPTYQSNRAFIPKHNAAKQVQVELGLDQVDLGYSINEHLAVNAGGLFQKSENESTTTVNGATYTDVIKQSLKGGHLGLSYFTNIDQKKNNIFSINAGSAFQIWDYKREGDDPKSIGFDRFEAKIINPFVQGALSSKTSINRSAIALRYEQPMFDFQNASPDLAITEKPKLLNVVISSEFLFTDRLSFFTQFIWRHNFDYDESSFDTYTAYNISSWNLYFGLAYLIDFNSSAEPDSANMQQKDNEANTVEL